MRGDEAQLAAAAGGDDSLGSTGPRHAAPRKSLLTKLQIPTSKALALAAMPTAVFVGMGLTPKLAVADNGKDAAANPCVTREDADPSDEKDDKKADDKKAGAKDGKDADESGSGKKAESSPSPSADDKAEATPEPEATGDGKTSGESKEPADDEAEASPSPSETKNPLDPLGWGDKIKDFFTPDDEESEEPAPEESDSDGADGGSAEKPADGDETAGDDASGGEASGGAKAGEKATGAAEKAKEKAEQAKKKAAKEKAAEEKAAEEDEELSDEEKLKAEIEDAAQSSGSKVEELDKDAADDGCASDADVEPGIPLLPDDPFVMETDKLTLRGLDYHGAVDVKTQSGKVKKALKFTADELDIKSMHQKTVGPNGTVAHVEAETGSTTTFRDGQVTMYTEKLKGNLFGLVPIEFTPDSPPPLNVPFAFFTDVTVTQAGQFGGTITVPGLQNYFTGG